MSALVSLLVTTERLIGLGLVAAWRLVCRGGLALAGNARHLGGGIAAISPRTRTLAGAGAIVTALAMGAWHLRDGPIDSYEAAAGVRPLLKAKSWYYHLDKMDLESMRLNPADVVVMDHAVDGGREALTPAQFERMKTRPDGTRRAAVISYISVGEAEDYRWYWQADWSNPAKATSKPAWLGDSNCAWPDNYAVQFWHPGWKKIIYGGPDSFIGRIIKAGFDGVYLDRVDIYDQYKATRATAEADMVQFVVELAASARAMKPGFLIIAQNGEDLLAHKRYRRVIDGLGKEDLLHGLSGTGVRNTADEIAWSYDRIRKLQADYKPIFAVEYLVTREAIAETRGELRSLGIVPTFAHRGLDGSDPTMPRFEKEAAVGTPEYVKAKCADSKTAW